MITLLCCFDMRPQVEGSATIRRGGQRGQPPHHDTGAVASSSLSSRVRECFFKCRLEINTCYSIACSIFAVVKFIVRKIAAAVVSVGNVSLQVRHRFSQQLYFEFRLRNQRLSNTDTNYT